MNKYEKMRLVTAFIKHLNLPKDRDLYHAYEKPSDNKRRIFENIKIGADYTYDGVKVNTYNNHVFTVSYINLKPVINDGHATEATFAFITPQREYYIAIDYIWIIAKEVDLLGVLFNSRKFQELCANISSKEEAEKLWKRCVHYEEEIEKTF